MPPAAYALVILFALVSIAAGVIAARVVGPRRPWAPIVPALAAFGVLYLVGHRFAFGVGPNVGLFGFEVAIVSDVAFALVAAGAAAVVQRAVLGRVTVRA